MNEAQLINALETNYAIEAAPMSEFFGDNDRTGVWIQSTGEVGPEKLPAFDTEAWSYDPNEEMYRMGVAIEVGDFLSNNGWYAEPYDAETWLIFPN